uniref:30S ribosomal protein S8 n=1 Tax=Culex pipiens TaxID=7175 RepID=A0A8D8BYN7_CULPI
MTKNNLTNDLRKLQSTLKSKKPIQLGNNQLKSCLIAEKLAKNTANGKIIINSEVQKIVMVKPKPIKKKKIVDFLKSSRILPTITGHVLMSTTRGLMTHHQAIQDQTGGIILAIIY